MGIRGAILGDIAGSYLEYYNKEIKLDTKLFNNKCFFTDDTILSLATKKAIDENNLQPNFYKFYKEFGLKYPDKGYGDNFENWLFLKESKAYGSAGNGSAMRVSYIGEYYNSLKQVKQVAIQSARITHNTKSGLIGAVSVASAIYLAKKGATKEELLKYFSSFYGTYSNTNYPVTLKLKEMRKKYKWTELCRDSVPLAFRCLYESKSYEEFLYNVLSVPCDRDTIGAIGGGIAEEIFGFDKINTEKILKKYLDNYLYNCLII